MREIQLTRGFVAVVDDEDFDHLNQWRWRVCCTKRCTYACRWQHVGWRKRQLVMMHRYLLGLSAGDGRNGDHINGNSLDNRRGNLRIADTPQNCFNRASQSTNTSGYKGVSLAPRQTTKWRAAIQAYGKRHYLGVFDTVEEAARAYNKAAVELHGEFAYQNPV